MHGPGSLSLTHASHVMRWKAKMNPSLARPPLGVLVYLELRFTAYPTLLASSNLLVL